MPSESSGPQRHYALTLAGTEGLAPRSHETLSSGWTVSHAVSGLRIVAAPAGTSGGWSRLLLAVWPLLSSGAIEIRWLGDGGSVSCFVLVRTTADNDELAVAESSKRLDALAKLAALHIPGWQLVALTADDIRPVVTPFVPADGGDLLRREVSVDLNDSDYVDVPVPHGANSAELQIIVDALASALNPTMLSLVAAPTEIDAMEEDVLLGELTRVELATVAMETPSYDIRTNGDDTPASKLRVAAELLRKRVLATDQIGFLRVTLSSAAPLEPHLVAAVQEAASEHAGSLVWTPVSEPHDMPAFTQNLQTLGFQAWGMHSDEQPGHESINDCYLASLGEILGSMRVPVPTQYSPLAIEAIDPAPRPVPSLVPRLGRMLGASTTDETRPVGLSEGERNRHTYVVGQTGTGKSTSLLNLLLQDIYAGQGCCLIDPHGDLVDAVLERYPESRAQDLVLLDATITERVVGLNPLEADNAGEQDFVIQQLIGMLYRIYDPGHTGIIGPRFEHWLRNAALTVMADPTGGTLLEIPRVFTSDAFLARKLQHVTDPVVRSFWIEEMGQTSDYHKSEMLGWFVAKFGAFNTNTAMRGILSQPASTIDIKEIMDTGKVLLVKLPKGVLGEINAMWLGMILISKIQMSALSRATRPPSERTLFNLYVDEFQSFANTEFDSLIAEARKYNLALTLAHQHVEQLSDSIRSAVLGNVATWLLFRVGLHDAQLLEDQVDGFSARDLTRLPNHRCVVRTAIDGRPIPPFDVSTLSPDTVEPDFGRGKALARLSILTYGRDAATVEREYRRDWSAGGRSSSGPDSSNSVGPASGSSDSSVHRDSAGDSDGFERKWLEALASANANAIFEAGTEYADYLRSVKRLDEAGGVLEATLEAVGSTKSGARRRKLLALKIADVRILDQPERAALALAKTVFAQGFEDADWNFVFEAVGPLASEERFRRAFDHITDLHAEGEHPTWAELDADPFFSAASVGSP